MSEKERKKIDSNPDGTEKASGLFTFFSAIICIIIFAFVLKGIVAIGEKGLNTAKDIFGGNSHKKEQCINQTRNIKNEFTAKKLYKQCMKR